MEHVTPEPVAHKHNLTSSYTNCKYGPFNKSFQIELEAKLKQPVTVNLQMFRAWKFRYQAITKRSVEFKFRCSRML